MTATVKEVDEIVEIPSIMSREEALQSPPLEIPESFSLSLSLSLSLYIYIYIYYNEYNSQKNRVAGHIIIMKTIRIRTVILDSKLNNKKTYWFSVKSHYGR